MSETEISYPCKTIGELAFIDPENLPESTNANQIIHYIDIGAVSPGKVSEEIASMRFEDAPSRARRVVVDSDILMSTVRPSLRSYALINKARKNTVASTGFAVLRAFPTSIPEYIYQNLFSDFVQVQIECLVVGSNYPAINSSDVRNLLIPVPLKSQQQKIAYILTTTDNLIEKTQTLINKYTAIKQGMMADLFTRGIDLSGTPDTNPNHGQLRPPYEDAPELYKQTELGWVPNGWEAYAFEQLADYKNGGSFSSGDWKEEGLPIIRIQNLNGSDEYNYYQGAVKESWHVLPGDLLFAWSGQKGVSFGARLWRGPEGVLNQHIFKVYENKKLLSRQFLYYLFKINVGRIEDNAHGFKDSFVHVTRSELTDVSIMLPPTREQDSIEARVLSIDSNLEIAQKNLSKHKEFKKGLMQDLLTGKVKVS